MPTTFQEIPRNRPTTPLLDRAGTPAGLRRLAEAELETLADELRLELLYTVGQTGGHFGAGLGVIELKFIKYDAVNSYINRFRIAASWHGTRFSTAGYWDPISRSQFRSYLT